MNSLDFHKKTFGPKKAEEKKNGQVHKKLNSLYSSHNAGKGNASRYRSGVAQRVPGS